MSGLRPWNCLAACTGRFSKGQTKLIQNLASKPDRANFSPGSLVLNLAKTSVHSFCCSWNSWRLLHRFMIYDFDLSISSWLWTCRDVKPRPKSSLGRKEDNSETLRNCAQWRLRSSYKHTEALRIKASNISTSGSGAFPFGCSILSCQTMGFRIMRKWKVHQASLCDTSHSSLCITRTTWSSRCSNKWRAAPDSDGCVVTWNNHIIVVIRYELELAPTASDLCQGYVYFTHPNQSYVYFKLHQTSNWIWPMGWWHSFSEASPAALSVSSCSQSWLVVINILHAQRSSNDWSRSFKPLMEYPNLLWFRDLETNTPAYQKTSWLASSCHFEPQNVSQFNQEINYIPYISIYKLYVHGDFILGKFIHQHTFKLWLNPCATMLHLQYLQYLWGLVQKWGTPFNPNADH